MLKLTIDRVIALFILIFLSLPVFLPVFIIIRLTSKGNAIYSQSRVGKDCKLFQLYKFRSMYIGADKHGYQTTDGDSRITPVGNFIRKTSIDELPQIFNVLKGDMSLVGPRPDTPMQKTNYSEEDWNTRHQVRPGITGLAQINGRSNIGTKERLYYDLEYVKKHSIWFDIIILFKTVKVAVGKGTN